MPCDRGDESKEHENLGKFIEDLKKEIGVQNLYLEKKSSCAVVCGIDNVFWINLSVELVVESRVMYMYGGCRG